MSGHVIIVDGYNLILRTPALKPGPERTLEEARDKLVNLLSWTIGGGEADFIVVFDGAGHGAGIEKHNRVEVRYSKPPRKADDDIRDLVEDQVQRAERVTVVTADLAVARHARAMGAAIAIADLFLGSVLGPSPGADPEKPAQLSRKELEEWAEIFKRREGRGEPGTPDDEGGEPH